MPDINLMPSDEDIDYFIKQNDFLYENQPLPSSQFAEQDGDMNSVVVLLYIDDRIKELRKVKSFGSGNGRVLNVVQQELLQSMRVDIFGERLT